MSEEQHVDLDDDATWIAALRTVRAEIDRLVAQKEQIEAHLKERMGDAAEARVDGQAVIRWAWTKPGTYIDKAALETDHPDIAAYYTRERKAARRFVVVDVKEPA